MLATTSYAVGGARSVAVHIGGEQETTGAFVRRYPQHDLALIATRLNLARKPAIAPTSAVVESLTFTAFSATGAQLRGQLTRADRTLPRHWLATNIHLIQMPDAGGNPLIDAQGQLVGLLTRNSDRSATALALQISHVLALAEAYRRERQLLPHTGYCPACGARAQAEGYGGRSCETCGAALPAERRRASIEPDRDALLQLYGEPAPQHCAHCRATTGESEGRCLRCGQMPASRAAGG